MTALDISINQMINSLEPEFRIPVVNALRSSDGSLLSFQQELSAQVWDTPDLPVQDILDRVAFDVA
jgi:predicted metal-dependent peptidase